jgi:spermidine synthase
MQGLHLTADLSGCKKNLSLMTDADHLRRVCLDLVESSGLTVVGELFHAFPGLTKNQAGGVTGTILLAESHLALHTWPEQQAVTLDVYVCNFSTDNSKKANQLLNSLVDLFEPADANCQNLLRGEVGHAGADATMGQEYLNKHSSYAYRLGPLLHREQSPYQLIEVHESPQFGTLFRLDGDYMTSESEEFFYHEALVHPAAISHGKVRNALILGGGDGGSAEELLKYPSVERIVLAELDEAVIRISRQYLSNIHKGSLDDPRVEIRIGDGLAYVNECHEQFDLVLLDLTDPDTPASELYTAEFFQSVKRILAPGGAMVLHTGSPVFSPQTVQTIYQRLTQHFANVAPFGLYIPLYGAYWSFALCSEQTYSYKLSEHDVLQRIESHKLGKLNYYNEATHFGLFALPGYFRDLLR